MRRVKKACVSSSAIPSWWSTQPSRVTLMLKVKSPMVTSLLRVGRTAGLSPVDEHLAAANDKFTCRAGWQVHKGLKAVMLARSGATAMFGGWRPGRSSAVGSSWPRLSGTLGSHPGPRDAGSLEVTARGQELPTADREGVVAQFVLH